jgi:hypothetical protein
VEEFSNEELDNSKLIFELLEEVDLKDYLLPFSDPIPKKKKEQDQVNFWSQLSTFSRDAAFNP